MNTGLTINTIIVVGISLFVLLAVLQLILEKTDKNIGRSIVDIGAALVLSAVPSALELYAGLFSSVLGVDMPILNSSKSFTWICMLLGVLLIVFGCIINFRIMTPVYILNMVGSSKHEINNFENERKLNIAGYKIKEQVVDIMPILGNGEKIDKKTNGLIVKLIEEDVRRFSNRTEGKTTCFTGMAPVPYTILAGTFLTNTNISRFFEYERHKTESYYELSKNHSHMNCKWPSLRMIGSIQETDNEDVVLSISVSQKILDDDLNIFKNKPVVVLSVPDPKDNLILYMDQLIEYRNVIYNCIEEVIKQYYKNVKCIHIVAAIPACLSLEIGRAIGAGENRIPQVVAYHYVSSTENKYPFGVYISGANKGKLI